MRYEVYGVYSDTGVNYGPVVVCKSMKAAIKAAKETVSLNCKYWAVLVKARKHSYPYEIITGLRGANPTRITMLVSPNQYGNPILHEADGKRYWSNNAV